MKLIERCKALWQNRIGRAVVTGGLLVLLIIGAAWWFYGHIHEYSSYILVKSSQLEDIGGTQYAFLGDDVVKYSPDGVFFADKENEVKWSIAYSMQTPVSDICRSTMAIAEEQGQQVYVINRKGLVGHFETSLSIRKVRVSASGNVALILQDGQVTWINLYTADGTAIASIRTTVEESGYPVDIAMTPDTKRMMVSYLGVTDGELTGSVAFYDFSAAQEDDHLVALYTYPRKVFPSVYYAEGKTPVAVGDDCTIVYTSAKEPKEKTRMVPDGEIISMFHDMRNIGFIFRSTQLGERYRMKVYNLHGKILLDCGLPMEYASVEMDDGEIHLYDTTHLYVYRMTGKQKLAAGYEKEVVCFKSLPGNRNYLVICKNSMDQIRIS